MESAAPNANKAYPALWFQQGNLERRVFRPCVGTRGATSHPSRHSGAMRSIEPGISRFRVWSFGPSRNDKASAYFGCSFNAAELMQ
jgi:hypothetical protein